MSCEEFLLRLAQYWAVICATRSVPVQERDPADQRITRVLLRLYKKRHEIACGEVAGVEFLPPHDGIGPALRMKAHEFHRSIGTSLGRPFKLFSPKESFGRSTRTFARTKTDVLQGWRAGEPPVIDGQHRLIERFHREAGVDLRRDLQYSGVLVVEKPARGEALLRLEPLTPVQARAYGSGLLRLRAPERRPLPILTGASVVRTQDVRALREVLGVTATRIVAHPAVAAAKKVVEESLLLPPRHIRISGRAGTGKTTLLYHMATKAPEGLILVLTPVATALGIEDFLTKHAVSVVLADDAHDLPAGLLGTPMRKTTLIATYLSAEERVVRERHPALFAADVNAIVLDTTTREYLRDVTRTIAEDLKVTLADDRIDEFVGHVRNWDATPAGIKLYLQDFAGREWDEPGFWLREDRHAPWANRFQLLGERDQTVLRLMAVLVTTGIPHEISYLTLRRLFVEYCGGRTADVDAAILSLRDAGWYSIREPQPGSVSAQQGERFIETDWARIPENAFGIRELFLDNLLRWSEAHGLYNPVDRWLEE